MIDRRIEHLTLTTENGRPILQAIMNNGAMYHLIPNEHGPGCHVTDIINPGASYSAGSLITALDQLVPFNANRRDRKPWFHIGKPRRT